MGIAKKKCDKKNKNLERKVIFQQVKKVHKKAGNNKSKIGVGAEEQGVKEI